jgi:hypothetical protein
VVGYDAREVREVGAAADELPTTIDGLPTTTDGLPSSPGFGDGELDGVGEEVGASDEDLDVDEDAPYAPSAPPAHAYSTVKSRRAVADLSQSRPSSNTTLRATRTRRVHWIQHAVGLGPLCVADEDPRRAAVVELADVVQLLDKGEAAEDAPIADRRLVPMLGLIWRLAVECTGRRAVEQMYSGHHGLPQWIADMPHCLRRARAAATTV